MGTTATRATGYDAPTVAGISSGSMGGKPGQYGITDVYTRVSAYTSWLNGVVRAAGGG